MAFSKGDVVKLKSGGPPMTVVSLEGTIVICRWPENSFTFRDGFFDEEALMVVPPPAGQKTV